MAAIVANCAISLNCELTQPVKVQYIDGNMFSMDNAGNTAHVYVFYNGEPQEIVGSVSADVIRSDGTTVAITGAMSGNRAYVIFPQSCYAVPGVVSVVIKVTEGTTVTTIAAFVANVYRSSTDTIVDPGTIIPSVQNLISAIETAVASIPADYSSLWESLAPDYANITFPVTAGKYCTYNGTLYIAKVDIATTESFTAAHWQSTNIGDNLSALNCAFTNLDTQINGDIVDATWTLGSLFGADGYVSTNKWAYSSVIPSGMYSIKVPSGYRYQIFIYVSDTSGTLVANNQIADGEFTVANSFIVSVGKTSAANLTNDDLTTIESSFIIAENSQSIVKAVENINRAILSDTAHLGAYSGDLNSLSANGLYAFTNLNNATNAPTTKGGTLLCYKGNDASAVSTVHLYVTGADGDMYYRILWGSSTWTGWKKVMIDNGSDFYSTQYATLSLFEHIGIIGDSYASGWCYPNGAGTGQNKYDISWGQILARRNGITCINISSGGLTTKTWLTSDRGLEYLNAQNAQNLYFICLGLNDQVAINNNTYTLGDSTDFANKTDTFYGNYAKIIDAVKAKAPDAKIVLCTVSEGNTTSFAQVSNAIIAIGALADLPVIDVTTDPYMTSTFFNASLVYSHPTAASYSGYALMMERLFSRCCINNPDYFKDYYGN